MFTRIGVLSLLFSSFFISAPSLSAGTIFSIGGSIQGTQYSLSGVEVAISFIASSNETITGASVVGSDGTLTLQIEHNLNGAPSDSAVSGGTATASLSNPGTYTATTSLSAALAQGQEYWIVLSGPVSINESSAAAGSVAGVNGDWTSKSGANWTTEATGSGYYYPNLTLSGTIAATPEPGTAALSGTAALLMGGFAGVQAFRRRQTHPAA